jgi:hypothetical protein
LRSLSSPSCTRRRASEPTGRRECSPGEGLPRASRSSATRRRFYQLARSPQPTSRDDEGARWRATPHGDASTVDALAMTRLELALSRSVSARQIKDVGLRETLVSLAHWRSRSPACEWRVAAAKSRCAVSLRGFSVSTRRFALTMRLLTLSMGALTASRYKTSLIEPIASLTESRKSFIDHAHGTPCRAKS